MIELFDRQAVVYLFVLQGFRIQIGLSEIKRIQINVIIAIFLLHNLLGKVYFPENIQILVFTDLERLNVHCYFNKTI